MAAAGVDLKQVVAFRARLPERVFSFAFFALLAAYTLSTMDGEAFAPGMISAAFLLFTVIYLLLQVRQRLAFRVPVVCLLLMPVYAAAQTLWSPQKIAYNGWAGVIFWFTAAVIALVASQLFRDREAASRFRFALVVFGTAICVLDLLEQASHTNKYFWMIQSRYSTVSGPFAYWNNFAQFCELFLPITLWMGVSGRHPAVRYLVLSGLQMGAVIASGSRAGSALVIAEFLAIMLMVYWRKRQKAFLAAAAAGLLAAVLFAFAAGLDTLAHKLKQRDQLAARRNINAASIAMIRERPLTGWGLGSYVPVYRMFARYDDGTYVNRAHNDWLEWTAEGGVFFSGLMLVVFIWSIRPAIQSGWGIGVIAVCLHATVDYPFARLGVCAWYFAVIGMLAARAANGRFHTEPVVSPS